MTVVAKAAKPSQALKPQMNAGERRCIELAASISLTPLIFSNNACL
jgi:hypothetical protein